MSSPGSQWPRVPDDGTAGAAVPRCYRHPNRETYVRCARCDRPVCPDCMISAAVGFQCPHCVAEGRRTTREPQTVFGGRVTGRVGIVSFTIIGICVVVFVLQQLFPEVVTTEGYLKGLDVAGGQYYRLLTAAFLHGSVLHLLLNMYAIFIVGPPLEAAFGRVRFITLYLLSALGGSAASYLIADPLQPSLGASGAVFGLFGATLVVAKRLRHNVSQITVLIVINLAFSFIFARIIDWRAHLGGLVTGAVVAAAFAYAPKGLRTPIAVVTSVLVLAAETVAVFTRTQQLTFGTFGF